MRWRVVSITIAFVAVNAVACSFPLVDMATAAKTVPDHPNRCYRLYVNGPDRDSCLRQFPTGEAYVTVSDHSRGL